MSDLFDRPIVPIANEDDATATYEALRPYVTDVDTSLLVVYVVEKAGGAIDKAGVEQREEVAKTAFDAFSLLAADDGVETETRILYGTDISETIEDAARDVDASAIVFATRGGGRWLDLLSGSVRSNLVSDSDRPVVVLPSE